MPIIEGRLTLYQALLDEGIQLPPECRDVTIIIQADEAIQLNYVTYATGERLAQVGRALARFGEENK